MDTRVLIAGAGPTGLSLACDLARRGVPFRLIEAAPQPFSGSRAKGLQPRTLEVFEDLGILEPVLAEGGHYPRFCAHFGPLSLSAGRLNKIVAATPDVPFPNLWMLPQGRTTQLLLARLAAHGAAPSCGEALQAIEQDAEGVTASVSTGAGTQRLRARFLVGCDGGHSAVRKALGLPLLGESLEGPPIVMGDLELRGLSRDRWHAWPLAKGCLLALCPLPGTDLFQLSAPLRTGVAPPEPTIDGLQRFLDRAVGPGKLRLTRVQWTGLYRSQQARMVDRYRVGRIFLAGDAAHLHPPSGGQGLNTGVQDAYNLGWKLAAVLAGAPDALLDSYQAERLPIAASVLGLSKKLFHQRRARNAAETNQLGLSYRDGPLASDTRERPGALRAGDRAPDAPGADGAGQPRRLFQLFQGPHWTLLAFGYGPAVALDNARREWRGTVEVVRVVDPGAQASAEDFVDRHGHARATYGVRAQALVLVRPDGYLGHFSEPGNWPELESYLSRTLGTRSRQRPHDATQLSA